MLKNIAIVLLMLGAAYLAYSEFTGTARVDGKDNFALGIEKISALTFAEMDNALPERRAIQGIGADAVSLSMSMPPSDFVNRMAELGYECRKRTAPDRIWCVKYLHRGLASFVITFDFDLLGESIVFSHGQARRTQ